MRPAATPQEEHGREAPPTCGSLHRGRGRYRIAATAAEASEDSAGRPRARARPSRDRTRAARDAAAATATARHAWHGRYRDAGYALIQSRFGVLEEGVQPGHPGDRDSLRAVEKTAPDHISPKDRPCGIEQQAARGNRLLPRL